MSIRKTPLTAGSALLQRQVVLLVKKMRQGINWMQWLWMAKCTSEELQPILCVDEWMAGQLLFPGTPDRMECCFLSWPVLPLHNYVLILPWITLNLFPYKENKGNLSNSASKLVSLILINVHGNIRFLFLMCTQTLQKLGKAPAWWQDNFRAGQSRKWGGCRSSGSGNPAACIWKKAEIQPGSSFFFTTH